MPETTRHSERAPTALPGRTLVHVHCPVWGFPQSTATSRLPCQSSNQPTLPGSNQKVFREDRNLAVISRPRKERPSFGCHASAASARRSKRVGRSRSSVSCVLSLSAKSRGYWVFSPRVESGFEGVLSGLLRLTYLGKPKVSFQGPERTSCPLLHQLSQPTFAGTKALCRPFWHHFRHRLLANLPASPYGHCRWFDSLRGKFCGFVLPPELDLCPVALLPEPKVPSPAKVTGPALREPMPLRWIQVGNVPTLTTSKRIQSQILRRLFRPPHSSHVASKRDYATFPDRPVFHEHEGVYVLSGNTHQCMKSNYWFCPTQTCLQNKGSHEEGKGLMPVEPS